MLKPLLLSLGVLAFAVSLSHDAVKASPPPSVTFTGTARLFPHW